MIGIDYFQFIMGGPKNEVFMSLFLRRPPSAHSSDHKKVFLTLPLSDVKPGANTIKWVGPILYTLGQNSLPNSLGTTVYIGLAPGRRSEVGGRTGAMSGEVEGGGWRGEGGQRQWRTADGEKFFLLFSNTPL